MNTLSTSPQPNPIGISCEAIIERNGKILMGKRGQTIFGAGTWALPGGHLENLEKVDDCVKRELAEEVGIKPISMELIGVVNDVPTLKGQVRHYVRFVYLIKEFSGDVRNLEPDRCGGWEWVEKNNLPSPLFVGHFKTLQLYREEEKRFLLDG